MIGNVFRGNGVRGLLDYVSSKDDILYMVCDRIVAWLNTRTGWRVEGLIESPILGADGNQEFLVYARKRAA